MAAPPAGLTIVEAVHLAAAHVEVRRSEPRAWHLLADALQAAAGGEDGGEGEVAAWWDGVREWWVEACFYDAAPAAAGAELVLRHERLRCARALQAALGGGRHALELDQVDELRRITCALSALSQV